MVHLPETVKARIVKDSLHILGFSAQLLRELPKTQNTKVVENNLLFLEQERI